MKKSDIEKEWKKEYKKFMDYHNKQIEKCKTQEEEYKYIKDNKVNEKLNQLYNKYKKMYADAE